MPVVITRSPFYLEAAAEMVALEKEMVKFGLYSGTEIKGANGSVFVVSRFVKMIDEDTAVYTIRRTTTQSDTVAKPRKRTRKD